MCLELYTPDQWEIDKDSVTLDKLIGQGHFGQVYQGVLKLQDGTLKPCAVKVKKSFVFSSNFRSFHSFEQHIQLIYYRKHRS